MRPLDIFAPSPLARLTAVDSIWLAPHDQRNLPLPPLPPSPEDQQQLRVLLDCNSRAQLAHQDNPQGATPDHLLFHRPAFIAQNSRYLVVTRAAACYGCYPAHPSTEALKIAPPPQESCTDSTSLIPGNLASTARAKILEYRQRSSNLTSLASLRTYIMNEARESQTHTMGMRGEFPEDFFDDNLLVGLATGHWTSVPFLGTAQALPEYSLTFWHFIRSVARGNRSLKPVVPNDGFTSRELAQIFENIAFFFHVLYQEPSFDYLGTMESTFSRYSVLGGHLMYLQDHFDNRPFQIAWDAQPPDIRRQRTVAVLFHAAALWDYFARFSKRTMSDEEFFWQVKVGSCQDITFLRPVIAVLRQELQPLLKNWRREFEKHFALHRLQESIQRQGPYLQDLPHWMRPPLSLQEQTAMQRRLAQQQRQHLQQLPPPLLMGRSQDNLLLPRRHRRRPRIDGARARALPSQVRTSPAFAC